jgi:hypothetical protein
VLNNGTVLKICRVEGGVTVRYGPLESVVGFTPSHVKEWLTSVIVSPAQHVGRRNLARRYDLSAILRSSPKSMNHDVRRDVQDFLIGHISEKRIVCGTHVSVEGNRGKIATMATYFFGETPSSHDE